MGKRVFFLYNKVLPKLINIFLILILKICRVFKFLVFIKKIVIGNRISGFCNGRNPFFNVFFSKFYGSKKLSFDLNFKSFSIFSINCWKIDTLISIVRTSFATGKWTCMYLKIRHFYRQEKVFTERKTSLRYIPVVGKNHNNRTKCGCLQHCSLYF